MLSYSFETDGSQSLGALTTKTASPDEKTLDVCEKYWLSSSLAVEDPRVQGLDLLTVCASAKPSFGIKEQRLGFTEETQCQFCN